MALSAAKLTFLDSLFASYSFKELVEMVISKIGYSSLIVLFSAYIAAILLLYFTIEGSLF